MPIKTLIDYEIAYIKAPCRWGASAGIELVDNQKRQPSPAHLLYKKIASMLLDITSTLC